jgi:hypothetical protein
LAKVREELGEAAAALLAQSLGDPAEKLAQVEQSIPVEPTNDAPGSIN